ncbi:hypothetical protein T4A_500 [Trichinella pseudospiralis]|uniref:Uncharacterized protein n=1 Tax=Trichinella pseudospiralis TaxID=6337 RepID=A0A0V1DJV4_TRIPS|nr:hypothetical protein T4A_500 [Trichinella pseudospiralis]
MKGHRTTIYKRQEADQMKTRGMYNFLGVLIL